MHDVTGVPEFSYPSLDQEIIMQELNKKYPDFEKKTGWRLDSEYKEMPEALAHDVSHNSIVDRFSTTSFPTTNEQCAFPATCTRVDVDANVPIFL